MEWWNGNGNGKMMEWWNGGMAEWRKMTLNPKTRNGCQGMLRELLVQRHSSA